MIDRAVLQTLARDVGDDAIVEEICDLFLTESRPARGGDASGARARATPRRCASHAHTLKGARPTSARCWSRAAAAELEALARAATSSAAEAWLTRLADAVELTRAALGRTPA